MTDVDDEAWFKDRQRFVADAERAVDQHQEPLRDHGFPLGPLAQQFATLTYSLLDADTPAEVLGQVVATARRLVPGADLVSVTLRSPDGRFHTPVESSATATVLDQLQYETGEGPCVESARPSGPAAAVSQDLAEEPRWPKFGPAAAELGVRAVLSTVLLPNATPPRLSGALNIYSRERHGLDDADVNITLLLATHASLALARVDAVSYGELQATQLRQAVDSRDVIGQAKGIIMARRGVPAGEAFDLLRSASQQLNVKLVALAETLATRHTEIDLPES